MCEKQNVCEHRNEWLPGSTRDMAIEKFPHKDCRGRVARELQGSGRSKRAEFRISKEGSPQEQVGSREHRILELGDSPAWPLEAQSPTG